MIDFHIHTNCSDGMLSPAEILQAAENLGLTHISITDHNTVSAYEQIREHAVRALFSGQILLGTEFSVHFNGRPVDLLGYGLPFEAVDTYCKKLYPPLKARRLYKIEEARQAYTERGFQFDQTLLDQVAAEGGFWQDALRRALVAYPKNLPLFTNLQSVTVSKTFMYCELNNPDSPFYLDVTRTLPSIEEVCAFIRAQGGISILAHPGIYDVSTQDQIEAILQAAKPDGLEAWYILHTEQQRTHFLAFCEKHNLLFSIGSDYHNDRREAAGNLLGVPAFQDICPIEQILQWAEKLPLI